MQPDDVIICEGAFKDNTIFYSVCHQSYSNFNINFFFSFVAMTLGFDSHLEKVSDPIHHLLYIDNIKLGLPNCPY